MRRNLLSADQASTRLGVQRATVYAYVSRGLLSRSVGDDGRTSWFDPDEVDALARRGRPRTRTERAGSVDVVLASGLTQIVGGHLRYRGHDVADLAATTSFEATAELLWAGSLPDGTVTWPAPRQELDAAVAATDTLPLSAPIAARLATAVAAVAAADEARGDLRPETVRRKARVLLGVLARTPAPVGTAADRTESTSVAAQLWPRLSPQRPTSARVGALDAALVLLADHELATSTLAARVAASTRANPFACVLSAIGALSGPLHGRAAIGTHRVLTEALATGDAAAAVDGALDSQERIPGLGHPLYDGVDPRAVVLLDRVDRIASPRAAATIDAVRRIAVDATGEQANVDFALGALALAGAMPFGSTEGVFAIGRTAGWVAHVLEEYDERPLRFRPRAIYTGSTEVPDR
jgi:citrate synthase